MPKQPKPEKRKPGRPKLSAEHDKGKIVPVRFAESEMKRFSGQQRNKGRRFRSGFGAR
jgi:hypothetical protein